MSERKFEDIFIKKLISNGYIYMNQEEIFDHRKNIENILLLDEIELILKKLNPQLTCKQVNDAIKQIKTASSSDLIIANESAMKKLVYGVKVYDENKKVVITCKLIDFDDVENNKFVVTNQFKMRSTHRDYRTQYVDIVIYLNGFPIIVGELKNPDRLAKSLELAFEQIQNYQLYLKDLFVFNCFNFISDKYNNKYGTITSKYERYFNWFNKNSNENLLNSFIEGLFSKTTILNLIKDFLFFKVDDKSNPNSKVIAGYHQYMGVNSAIENIVKNRNSKGGIFWHTQGSGKSYSMIFLSKKFLQYYTKGTIVVVTDRKDLDYQLTNTFIEAQKFLGQLPERIQSINALKEKLLDKKQNGIFLTTIQKFTEDIGILSNRSDILVIADEAHRSHNLDINLEFDLENLKIKHKEGNAERLRKAFTNAIFIGFTGTPIEREDKSTSKIFGDYVSKYLMIDAVRDSAIVDIFYEPRKKELHKKQNEFEILDNEYEAVKDRYKDSTFMSEHAIKILGAKINAFERLIENDERIKEISKDFITHYKSRINILKGKALFVAFNRRCAVKYYKEITLQAPELKKNIKVIMTTNKQSDPPEILNLVGSDEDKKLFAKKFKDPEDDFKIAIVVDMWLTGFDVPCLDVIYIDKWLKMHSLMQAIARVNRVYSDEKTNKVKTAGLIVDYIGLWKNLNKALEFYNANGDNVSFTGKSTSEIKQKLIDLLKHIINQYFKKFENKIWNYQNNSEDNYKFLEQLHNYLIENDKIEEFINDSEYLSSMLAITIGMLKPIEIDIVALLIVLRKEIINFELGRIDIESDARKLSNKIQNAIVCRGNYENENNRSPVSLKDLMIFLANIANKKDNLSYNIELAKNTGFIMVDELKKSSIIRAKKLSEKIEELIEQLSEGHLPYESFMSMLCKYADEIINNDEAEKLNLSDAEYSFYEIISQDKYRKSEFTSQDLINITQEIYNKVKNIVTNLWNIRPSEKGKVRSEIKKILMKYNFPKESYSDSENSLRSQLTRQIEELVENDFIFG